MAKGDLTMKYVRKLTDPELVTLEFAYKDHASARVRARAHIIILSGKGYPMQAIADICEMTRQTVSAVINRWEESGIAGLYDRPRPGKPRSLTSEDEYFIHDFTEREPRSVNKIIAALENLRGKKVGRSTVRRVLKKKKVWKRIRKSLKGKRDEEKFREAQEEIKRLEQRRKNGELELYYFDEAGFNLTPCVPYAWQPTGEYIEVSSAKGETLNVLAFLSKNNDCTPFIFGSRVNTDVVVACFDNFSGTLTGKNVVIMDNAPVHKSKKFLSRLPERHKKGLDIIFLPPYSPELNLIEILWRKMKYEWLPFSAYTSFSKLKERVEDIFVKFGSEYTIEFA